MKYTPSSHFFFASDTPSCGTIAHINGTHVSIVGTSTIAHLQVSRRGQSA